MAKASHPVHTLFVLEKCIMWEGLSTKVMMGRRGQYVWAHLGMIMAYRILEFGMNGKEHELLMKWQKMGA